MNRRWQVHRSSLSRKKQRRSIRRRFFIISFLISRMCVSWHTCLFTATWVQMWLTRATELDSETVGDGDTDCRTSPAEAVRWFVMELEWTSSQFVLSFSFTAIRQEGRSVYASWRPPAVIDSSCGHWDLGNTHAPHTFNLKIDWVGGFKPTKQVTGRSVIHRICRRK
jgi:hypothetical protein